MLVPRLTLIAAGQVGAVALGAKLDCDAFADAHSSTAHYDPKSFVGMPVCLHISPFLARRLANSPVLFLHDVLSSAMLCAVETYVGVDLCGDLQHRKGQVSLAIVIDLFYPPDTLQSHCVCVCVSQLTRLAPRAPAAAVVCADGAGAAAALVSS